MKIMYVPCGKHTVANGSELFEFDNSDGSNVPTFRNTLNVPDSCGQFLIGKHPTLFKTVEDMPKFELPKISGMDMPEAGDTFIRLRPTNQPVAPIAEKTVDEPVKVEEPKSKIYGNKK
jgi:hypothetical protein